MGNFDEPPSGSMCFPPKFARSVPYLIDREVYLEDSCGRRWMATVCNYNGSLAIRQGWAKFSAEHDLKVGDFLLFHYVSDDRHFIVQIFGTSGCEKIKFSSDIGKGKPNERTYQEITTKEESQSASSNITLDQQHVFDNPTSNPTLELEKLF
ncbi:B3 domain-containing protein Os02g0598200-like [Solanum stenotomum]|uniref:B3 domain-containing protein Os02g0598200-like n=1 Tax=Solanum stenotomum TaxID=172797 RepID=UPI0020D05E87|nr:B3 domain-containing protein Os02g0598200-like [Solanum stenotomum]